MPQVESLMVTFFTVLSLVLANNVDATIFGGIGLLYLAILVIIPALLIFACVRARRRSRLIRNAPLCTAEDLPLNRLVKMRGRIQAVDGAELLESPMSRTPCLYYKFEVQARRRRGRTTYWVTIVKDINQVPYRLVDETGNADIDLALANLVSMPTHSAQTGGLLSTQTLPFEKRVRRRYGIIGPSSAPLIYRETLIEDGMDIMVAGEVKTTEEGELCFRKSALLPVTIAHNEVELESHYRGNFYSWLAACFYVPFALLLVGALIGVPFVKAYIAATSPPQVNNPEPKPPVEVKKTNPVLDRKLADLSSRDRLIRIRAAKDLAAMPVDEDHRHEVAQALNPLLDGTDPGQRDAGLEAVEQWGTRQDNGGRLSILSHARDPEVAANAERILNLLK
jgi:hypothetical protein